MKDNIINNILHGNCLEVLKELPDEYYSTCITDPPYNYEFIGHNWDLEESKRRTERIKSSNTLVKNIPYGSGLSGGVRNARWYKKNRDNILEYQNWIEEWGRELYRITKPGALILIFNSTRTIAHVQVALENCGFYARDIIVNKRHSGIPKGLNVSKKLEQMGYVDYKNWEGWHSTLRNEWEAICVLQKPLENNYINTLIKYNVGLFKTKDNENDSFQSNILEPFTRDKKEDFNTHPTVKSLKLMEKLVSMTTPVLDENIIIDPFSGSGTTLLAAKNLGLKFTGIELYKEYIDIANKRLQK